MTRPGPLVHAEHEARDEAILRGDDISDGCAACRAVARERERWDA